MSHREIEFSETQVPTADKKEGAEAAALPALSTSLTSRDIDVSVLYYCAALRAASRAASYSGSVIWSATYSA